MCRLRSTKAPLASVQNYRLFDTHYLCRTSVMQQCDSDRSCWPYIHTALTLRSDTACKLYRQPLSEISLLKSVMHLFTLNSFLTWDCNRFKPSRASGKCVHSIKARISFDNCHESKRFLFIFKFIFISYFTVQCIK